MLGLDPVLSLTVLIKASVVDQFVMLDCRKLAWVCRVRVTLWRITAVPQWSRVFQKICIVRAPVVQWGFITLGMLVLAFQVRVAYSQRVEIASIYFSVFKTSRKL